MTPEQKQDLQEHLQAIAKILYADDNLTEMHTLEDIELNLRQQIQAHVAPELGIFLSKQSRAHEQASPES